MNRIVSALFLFLVALPLRSQDFGFGFKAGLNFNNVRGEKEQDAAGNTVEKFNSNTGFHVGATIAWKATDLMGVRAELLYSQKGYNRVFDGPSYYSFYKQDGEQILTTGNRKIELDISQSYLDLPVTGYFKPLKWLEVYAGASVGFLVSSSAFGNLTYNGMTATGGTLPEVSYELDFSYLSDEAGAANFAATPSTVTLDGEKIPYPQTAGAYYEFRQEDRGNLYKVPDVGLLGGLSIFFNQSLYLSGRLAYGLTDTTKSKADVSLMATDGNGGFITRNDKDQNISIQASIGFSF